MAKFVFRLQSLLNVKTQMEDNLKNELGKVTRKLEEEKKILGNLKFKENIHIENFKKKSSQKVTIEKLKEYNCYISHLRDKIAKQKENVNLAQLNVDKVREELVKIVQERKMLDKLKERKFKDYLLQLTKKEQLLTDEIVSFKQSNRLTGEGNG